MGLREEELLRRFVACREAEDGDGAHHWWGRLAEANLDRVRGMVDLRARRYGLSHDERQEATQQALVKLWRNMGRTFKGATMGEFVNSTKALVEVVCKDVQRTGARRTSRETSFEPLDPEAATPGWKGDELARQRHRRDAEKVEAADFIAWALPEIDDERRQVVLERTRDGVPAEAIAAELDVSMANLYAIRSRAVKDLRKLWERYHS